MIDYYLVAYKNNDQALQEFILFLFFLKVFFLFKNISLHVILEVTNIVGWKDTSWFYFYFHMDDHNILKGDTVNNGIISSFYFVLFLWNLNGLKLKEINVNAGVLFKHKLLLSHTNTHTCKHFILCAYTLVSYCMNTSCVCVCV